MLNMSEPEYKTRTDTLDVSGLEIKLNRITNIDELYSALLKKDSGSIEIKDERIPYWAELWPSAIAMSEFIVENKIVSNKTFVHETGCGLALPGIVCGKLGANVLLTDYLPEALEVAAKNWLLNFTIPAQTQLMDWRKPFATKCDVLLAADVAYEKRMFGVLVKMFSAIIKPGGKIIFSEPNRQITEPFYNMLLINGFKISTTTRLLVTDDFEHKINVSVITKQ